MIYARTVAAAGYVEKVEDIPLRADLATKRIGGGQLEVTPRVTIRPTADTFTVSNGTRSGRIAINYFIVSEDGRILAQAWDTLDLNLGEEAYQKLLRDGATAEEHFQLSPGNGHARFKIVVYCLKTDKLGTATGRAW